MLRLCVSVLFSSLLFVTVYHFVPVSDSVQATHKNTIVNQCDISQPVELSGAFPIQIENKKQNVRRIRRSADPANPTTMAVSNTGAQTSKPARAAKVNAPRVHSALTSIYTLHEVPADQWPAVDHGLLQALEQQLVALRKSGKRTHRIGNLTLTTEDIKRTINQLKELGKSGGNPADLFDTHLLCGKDNKGNVKFTGYYTPLIKASSQPSGDYDYRLQINRKGKSVVCYVRNYAEVRNIRLQGSGYVEIDGNEQIYISYAGGRVAERVVNNGVSQTLIDQQPAVDAVALETQAGGDVFVQRGSKPTGAAGVSLLADYSIAVDTRYIPMGSVVLAYVPYPDAQGRIKYQYRYLLAQDTGGAVKGTGHVDYYTGVGHDAWIRARHMARSGKIYLITPKQS